MKQIYITSFFICIFSFSFSQENREKRGWSDANQSTYSIEQQKKLNAENVSIPDDALFNGFENNSRKLNTGDPTEHRAQSVWSDNSSIVSDEKTGYHSYIPYPYVSEDDILWAKRVTKKIDTRMLQNHPLYFPIDVTHTGYKLSSNGSPVGVKFNEVISGIDARKNLYQILYDAATTIDPSTGRPLVSTYNISMTRRYENDEVVPDFENGFAGAFGYRVEIPAEDDGDEPFIAYAPYEANQVLYYLIDEEVFFDKKRSKLDYRYVSITAVIIDESNEPKALPTFYFPEIRHLLSNHKIFPLNGNMAQRISFDEFFHRKAFASNIVKETNVYDRRIDTYLPTSLEQLLEGERIKEQIRRYESDMWNY